MKLQNLSVDTKIVTTSILLLIICALIAGVSFAKTKTQEHYFNAEPTSSNVDAPPQDIISLTHSNRNVLIKNMIRNWVFYCTTFERMKTNPKYDDINSLYDAVQNTFEVKYVQYDILCQAANVNNNNYRQTLDTLCNQLYIGHFSSVQDVIVPTFQSRSFSLMNNTTRFNTYMFKMSGSEYRMMKSEYEAMELSFSYDTNHDMLRMNFHAANGHRSNPAYFILASPYALEIPQIGIFNIVYDFEDARNMMNGYKSDSYDPIKSVYLFPTAKVDNSVDAYKGKVMNYKDDVTTLNQVVNIMNNNKRTKNFLFYYPQYEKDFVHEGMFHTLTIHINNYSSGSVSATYNGTKTNFVRTLSVEFVNNMLTVRIDNIVYTAFTQDINELLSSEVFSSFDIYVTLAYNTVRVVFMYKKDSINHSLAIYRTPLRDAAKNVAVKVFAFERLMNSTSSHNNYIFANQGTIKVYQHIPNLLNEANVLGYNFT